ncbi:MAG: efflux RND transporter periplasmic adaptor subunit [Bacteroidales bacterium]|nr:efflux RND transporter periplasmic adaptor subunit [Bacteroidales bacterium]
MKSKDEEKAQPKEKPQIKVDAFILKPSLLINEISVSGSLKAFEEVELKSEVAGRVVKINLPEGQFVKEGTLLVKLFDGDLQANLNKLQSQLALQEDILRRQSELLKVNGISQNEYEQTALQVNSIKAEIEVQKVLIRKTEVLAPFDGVIGLRNISVGAQVTPSTTLATIRSQSKLKLDFSVPEKYGPEIKPGMNVKFTSHNDTILYDATVIASERGIDASTRNLKVRAVVNTKSDRLIPGSFTNVLLRLSENKNALVVPTQSIIPKEQFKSVIVAQNGKAHFIKVKTGIRKENIIEITEGINPGDTIITSGILFLKEGSKLHYASLKTE